MTLSKGKAAEQYAKSWLMQRGLQSVAQNIRYPFGEIDLIMRDASGLVFVEVKYRSSSAFGDASFAVTYQKQKRLKLAAQTYLKQHHCNQAHCRFDVVSITGHEIQWIKNAF